MTSPAARNRRPAVLGWCALAAFAVRDLGQGSWTIGAGAAPSAVSAIITDVTGGPGGRQPIRVQALVAVSNLGTERVRVLEPARAGDENRGADPSPAVLDLEPGGRERLSAEISLDCRRTEPPQVPALEVERRDGSRVRLEIGGSDTLLEACARAAARFRPLTVTVTGPLNTETLAVEFHSPTGRRIDITAIRAGGIALAVPSAPVTVTGRSRTRLRLPAPKTCPAIWQTIGVPSALAVDISSRPATSGTGAGATVTLAAEPALTTWLLATACAAAK